MILGYEEPVQMPTMDIYSTDLMKMYIAAVKEQYDTAKEEYKDFLKSYQDFYSVAPGANQEYYNLTLGGAQNLMKQLAERGVDPFKSAEGRAAISNFINSVPVGRINALRQEAQIADEYLKSRDKLRAEGKFDPLTDAIVGGGNFDTWDRSKQGPWNRRYAIENKSLGDLTSDFYSKLQKDEHLGPDESRGADSKYYDLYGVSQDTLKTADAAALQALKDTPYYNLFAMKASGLTDAEGNPINPDVALANMIRQTNEKYWAQPESKKNELAIERWKEARADARTARTIAASRKTSNSTGGGSEDKEPSDYSYTDALYGKAAQQLFGNSYNPRYSIRANFLSGQAKVLQQAGNDRRKAFNLLKVQDNAANYNIMRDLDEAYFASPRDVSKDFVERLLTVEEAMGNMSVHRSNGQGGVGEAKAYIGSDNARYRTEGNSIRKEIQSNPTAYKITTTDYTLPLYQDGKLRTYKVHEISNGKQKTTMLEPIEDFDYYLGQDDSQNEYVNPTSRSLLDSKISTSVGNKQTKVVKYPSDKQQ